MVGYSVYDYAIRSADGDSFFFVSLLLFGMSFHPSLHSFPMFLFLDVACGRAREIEIDTFDRK